MMESDFENAAQPIDLIATAFYQFDATYSAKPLTVLHGLLNKSVVPVS
jgi:hypothetical protein